MIYVPFFYFVFLFAIMLLHHKKLCVGSSIVFYYVISSFFGIIIWENKIWNGSLPSLGVEATVIYCSLLTMVIMPFFYFNSNDVSKIYLSKQKQPLFIIISWTLITLSFLAIITSWENILMSMAMDFVDVRSEYYRNASNAIQGTGDLPIYQYLLSFAPTFSPILVLFFFYSIIYFPKKYLMNSLLLISSATYTILSILTAARTQLIYWLMIFSVLLVFFFHLMSKSARRKVIISIIGFASLGFVYISAVTLSRADKSGFSAAEGTIYYIGQPFIQFNNVYNHYTFKEVVFKRTFPIANKYLLGDKNYNTMDYRDKVEARIGADIGVFYTFLGDAMVDYGVIGLFVYVTIIRLLQNWGLKRKTKTVSLSKMIIFVLLLRIPLLGLFAYMYAGIEYSVLIIGSLFIAFLLKSNSSRYLYEKNKCIRNHCNI